MYARLFETLCDLHVLIGEILESYVPLSSKILFQFGEGFPILTGNRVIMVCSCIVFLNLKNNLRF